MEASLLGIWFSIAGLLLARYATRVVLLRRRVARKSVTLGSQEWTTLQSLSRKAGLKRPPRLTESEELGSPIAFGIGKLAEICVPTRAIHELDPEEFKAMLGHEVAHHQRRDPFRLVVMNVLRSLFFFQPLFRIAGRDVLWAAEEQCDALAASHVQNPVAVARCLTEIAGWVLPKDHRFPVAGMAKKHSHLVHRVDRLIDEEMAPEVHGRTWPKFWSLSFLVLAPWLAPDLAPAAVVSHEDAGSVEEGAAESRLEHEHLDRETGGEHARNVGDELAAPEEGHAPEHSGETTEEHGAQKSGHGDREHSEH